MIPTIDDAEVQPSGWGKMLTHLRWQKNVDTANIRLNIDNQPLQAACSVLKPGEEIANRVA